MIFNPTKTGDEVVDRNLRDLADALEKIVQVLKTNGIDISLSAPIGAKAKTSVTVPTP